MNILILFGDSLKLTANDFIPEGKGGVKKSDYYIYGRSITWLLIISIILADYLRHAPCMRLVQAGYERCAADYQTRIKALNEQTQVCFRKWERHYLVKD